MSQPVTDTTGPTDGAAAGDRVAPKRVLVLGGNRYIGLHLVRELARRGHDVTVLNSHEVALPEGVTRLHGDRQQPGVLDSVLTARRDEFDVVFDNTAYHVEDLRPLVELFRDRVEHFVFTSSVAVYKRSFVQPVRETFRRHDPADRAPAKAYGVGKVQCEDYLAEEHERTGFPYTTMRVGHTFGPLSPLASREPIFFARLEAGRPILVPGEGFPFIHLVHVADVAAAMASIIGAGAAVGSTYNIVGSEITSIYGAIVLMAAAVGVEPNIVHVPMDIVRARRDPLLHWGEGLVGGLIFSIERARADLAWEPQFGLADGYADSYRWFATEGRDRYEFDFSRDDDVLAELARQS